MIDKFKERADFIWSVADEVLRDDIKRGKYPDIILPFTVLRRLDCVLAGSKGKVLATYEKLKKQGVKNVDGQLRRAAGHSFYNISPLDFPKLLDDAKNIGKNLRAYINGFSENMRDILDRFNLRNYIDIMDEKGLLFQLVRKFGSADLHPDRIDNHEMGTIFEDLIRRFNEQTNENPGEHFTPREVIQLMVRLVLNGDKEILGQRRVTRTVYDPACGSGGMLSIAKEYVLKNINPDADIRLFGQEVNDESYAIAKSDMLIKGDDRDADNIKPDSSFSKDGHPHSTFDYMLSNPPYGKDWKKERDFIDKEADNPAGRFSAGLPRINDGQMLFLQHMLSKMKASTDGGSRLAVVTNGSPLFTGDAGGHRESEIRRWILENDWLEAIVSLPDQLFYNTGITTYIWVLTNRKSATSKGRVLLVNGAATRKEEGEKVEVFAHKMQKSLGDKRNELGEEHITELTRLFASFQDCPYARVLDTADFGYRKITVERPLRLNFQTSRERLARLETEQTFVDATENGIGGDQLLRRRVLATLATIDSQRVFRNRDEFTQALDAAIKKEGLTIKPSLKKVIVSALSHHDDMADICKDTKGNPEPDTGLRDFENVALREDIHEYFAREVRPYVPDAWIDEEVCDDRDKQIGRVGYEINFNRYFYQYEPLRSLSDINLDIKGLEQGILKALAEVTHSEFR